MSSNTENVCPLRESQTGEFENAPWGADDELTRRRSSPMAPVLHD